jgi:hypothetical protein
MYHTEATTHEETQHPIPTAQFDRLVMISLMDYLWSSSVLLYTL